MLQVTRSQESFSRLWGSDQDGRSTQDRLVYADDKAALRARNMRAKQLRAKGYIVRCSNLPGQLRQYWGLGIPCGMSCTVYYINIVNARV